MDASPGISVQLSSPGASDEPVLPLAHLRTPIAPKLALLSISACYVAVDQPAFTAARITFAVDPHEYDNANPRGLDNLPRLRKLLGLRG